MNIFSILIVLLIGFILNRGITSSVCLNNIIVAIKILIILLFVGVGIFYVKPTNWNPFLLYGTSRVLKGASLVFFAYLGFDCVSASAAEVKNPKRNMPIGIIGTLVICTVLYMIVSAVLKGMVSYKYVNVGDSGTFALQQVNQNWVDGVI